MLSWHSAGCRSTQQRRCALHARARLSFFNYILVPSSTNSGMHGITPKSSSYSRNPSAIFSAHRKNEGLLEPFATCSSGLSLESYACRCCRRRRRRPLCAIPLHKDHKCNAKCHTLLSCIMTCALATRSRGRMSALCISVRAYSDMTSTRGGGPE